MNELLTQIQNCKACESHLEFGVNPIVAASIKSKVVIIGQAPGKIVHTTNIPWNDKSGDNLRSWLGVDKTAFYNTAIFSLMPMGFCYPGSGTSGDLPPRPECAPLWHSRLLSSMENVQLILLIGQYAQQYYLQGHALGTLTETVHKYKTYLPKYFTLPHPSPRNNIWQKKNPWFQLEVIPALQQIISNIRV